MSAAGTSRRSTAGHYHGSYWCRADVNRLKSWNFALVRNDICALRWGDCAEPASSKMRRNLSHGPRPSVVEPRRELLLAVRSFVRTACTCPGVVRIALMGSLVTSKSIPKDADVLVTINGTMDLGELARAGRRLKGTAQAINLGADIFLADATGRYLGRICHYRECHPRVACLAQHCGRREHLNDDLQIVTLSKELLAAPPVDLWPNVIRRLAVPADVEALLLTELERIQ
jgi:hypothetical protein